MHASIEHSDACCSYFLQDSKLNFVFSNVILLNFPMTSLINALQKLTLVCLSSSKFTTRIGVSLLGIHTATIVFSH